MPCHARNGRKAAAPLLPSFLPLISLSQRKNVHCCEMGEMGILVSFLSSGLRIIEQNRANVCLAREWCFEYKAFSAQLAV